VCKISFRSVYSVALESGGTPPPILPFFGLRRYVVSRISGVRRKLKAYVQLQTFPYPTMSKVFLYFNAFTVKSCAQTLSFKSVTNTHTNKKTKKSQSNLGRITSPSLWQRITTPQSPHWLQWDAPHLPLKLLLPRQ